MDNAADIRSYCNSPLFSCGYNAELEPLFEASHA
jgi:hypothetical protein